MGSHRGRLRRRLRTVKEVYRGSRLDRLPATASPALRIVDSRPWPNLVGASSELECPPVLPADAHLHPIFAGRLEVPHSARLHDHVIQQCGRKLTDAELVERPPLTDDH